MKATAPDPREAGDAILPSYPKLYLTLLVLVVAYYAPVNTLSIVIPDFLRPRPVPAPPEPPPPPAPPHRLFDEYPDALADRTLHPVECRSALWVSFRHLPRPEWDAALGPWQDARLIPVADGLYRLDGGRPVTAAVTRVLERYPYALAPGEHTDPSLTAAYRRVAGTTPFRVAVVRGDWLRAALAAEPAAAARLGVHTSPAYAARYTAAEITAEAVRAPFPPGARGPVAFPPTLTRRALEAAVGTGQSSFVRLATGMGSGVPLE